LPKLLPATSIAKKFVTTIDTRTGICDNLARVYEIVSINTKKVQ
jgi:hypothetical protein